MMKNSAEQRIHAHLQVEVESYQEEFYNNAGTKIQHFGRIWGENQINVRK